MRNDSGMRARVHSRVWPEVAENRDVVVGAESESWRIDSKRACAKLISRYVRRARCSGVLPQASKRRVKSARYKES